MSEGYGQNGKVAITFGETHAARPRDGIRNTQKRGAIGGYMGQGGANGHEYLGNAPMWTCYERGEGVADCQVA